MNTKKCNKCGKEYEATPENFYRAKKNKDGLFNTCKKCKREQDKEYAAKNQDKRKEWARKFQESNPGKYKDKNATWKMENAEHLYTYNKQYFAQNKSRIYHMRAIWREKNPESQERRKARYRSDRENARIRGHRYNSQKRLLESGFTVVDWEYCKSFFEHRCAYCGNEVPLVAEHFIPVSKGGGFVRDNIVPSCRPCNSRKRDKDFNDWYHKMTFYTAEREQQIICYLYQMQAIQP